MSGEAYLRGGHTWSHTTVKEKVGLSAGGEGYTLGSLYSEEYGMM